MLKARLKIFGSDAYLRDVSDVGRNDFTTKVIMGTGGNMPFAIYSCKLFKQGMVLS